MEQKYSDHQLYVIGTIYDLLARLLPVEGRDYNVIFEFGDKDNPDDVSISFKPHTDLGKMWCNYCSHVISHMREQR